MELGVLYLSHAILVLAELIVCSTRGPEASCIKRADTYFGRRSASLIKEFWTLRILLMTDSETVMVETISYSNIGLRHCL